MKAPRVAAALVLSCVGAVSAAPAQSAGHPEAGPADTYVAHWDEIGSQAFTAAGLSPAEGHIIFAYVAIAVYDAVMAVEGGYEPFAVDLDAPAGASPEAAVAAAANTILSHYLPEQVVSILAPAFEASMATIPDGAAKTAGVDVGTEVAEQLIALRADDGYRAPQPPYVPPDPPIPGVWLPTASTPPIGIWLGEMQPFTLRSADQFRPKGPPDLDSRRWALEYNEVQTIGSATSTVRTPEQTVAARFWAEPAVQQAHGAFRRFVLNRYLDIVQAARFMAMVSVTYADGLIACFDAKYHFAFWRPITAVRAGDNDGNRATVGDPSWSPLLPVTPNHPEYPSAHSCLTPAAGVVAARFLGTQHIDFTVPSLTGLGDRHFTTARDLQGDVADARIWGGIHFRSAVEDGTKIAKRVANQVLAHHFHPTTG